MALAQDQKAMLQLLLERDQTYADIASLLGGSTDDVRRRARAALEELGGRDPDAEVGLTDYLLGQADPIGRADAVRHLQSNAGALSLAEEIVAKLSLLAPDAKLPDLPKPKKRRRAAAPLSDSAEPADEDSSSEPGDDGDAGSAPSGSPLSGLSQRQSRLFAAIGASALILLFVVLGIAGAFSSEDDPAPTGAEQVSDEGTIDEEITTVNLRPAKGFDVAGEGRFGVANENQPFLDLTLAGLEPPPDGQTYVIWFLVGGKRGYPLAPITSINDNGTVEDRFVIPQAALPVAVRTESIEIALVGNRALASDIEQALQGEDVLLDFTGKTVASGNIPRLEEPPPGSDLEVPGAENGAPGSNGGGAGGGGGDAATEPAP